MVSDYYTSATHNVGQSVQEPTRFLSQFSGCMELHADTQTVTRYFDAHRDWFCRCAHPMKVQLLGDHGYTLTVGRLSAFGYEIEPKISLGLLPHERGYCIQTIPTLVPDQGYEVDFQAVLQLVEPSTNSEDKSGCESAGTPQLPFTQVEWHLSLAIAIQFPKFIQKLPQNLVQQTGDRLLANVVRQISQRLTTKVQADFHAALGLTPPKRFGRKHSFAVSKPLTRDLY